MLLNDNLYRKAVWKRKYHEKHSNLLKLIPQTSMYPLTTEIISSYQPETKDISLSKGGRKIIIENLPPDIDETYDIIGSDSEEKQDTKKINIIGEVSVISDDPSIKDPSIEDLSSLPPLPCDSDYQEVGDLEEEEEHFPNLIDDFDDIPKINNNDDNMDCILDIDQPVDIDESVDIDQPVDNETDSSENLPCSPQEHIKKITITAPITFF